MQLWSEDFNGANDMLDNGGGGDSGNYLLQELYGTPSDRGLVQQHPRRMVRPPTGRDAPSPAPSSSTRRRSAIRRPTRHFHPSASASLWPTMTRPPSIASGWADPAPLRHPGRAQHLTVQRQAPETQSERQGGPAQQGREGSHAAPAVALSAGAGRTLRVPALRRCAQDDNLGLVTRARRARASTVEACGRCGRTRTP